MYEILENSIRQLLQDIKPWIIGKKIEGVRFVPTFKESTPQEILQKYEELKMRIQRQDEMCNNRVEEWRSE